MVRWYITGPLALVTGLGLATIHPLLFPVGLLAIMGPIWVYRSRGRLGRPEQALKRIGSEMGRSVEAATGVLAGMLLLLWILGEALFQGAGELIGILAGQVAASPLPFAYAATSGIAIAGYELPAIGTEHIAIVAILAFVVAMGISRARRR